MPFEIHSSGIVRPVIPGKDLDQIANLIELCFAGHLDADGLDYIKFLRRLASNRIYKYAVSDKTTSPSPIDGFVYESEGKVVGNLSLIRFASHAQPIFLIANVAVHSDMRRQGIARSLTKRALDAATSQHASAVWLHVRDDNQAAFQLYQSLGFKEVCRRSTWNLNSATNLILPQEKDALYLSRRKRVDWDMQASWLNENYPKHLRWNLMLDEKRFAPGFLQGINQFLFSEDIKHWSASRTARLQGVLTWESTSRRSDNLWLATSKSNDEIIIETLIPYAINQIYNNNKPFSINYPEMRGDSAFESIGFYKSHTLIWMEIPYN